MFIGACAGSTGGGLKCSRVLLLFRCIGREIRQVIHPRSVNVVKLDGRVVEEDALRSVHIFFAAYMFITLLGTLAVAVDNFTFGTSFTAVVACISNIGPGLEMVGPMGNFSAFSPLSKVLFLCKVSNPRIWHFSFGSTSCNEAALCVKINLSKREGSSSLWSSQQHEGAG